MATRSRILFALFLMIIASHSSLASQPCSRFGADLKTLATTKFSSPDAKFIEFCDFKNEWVAYDTLVMEVDGKLKTESLNGFLSTVERKIVVYPDGTFERPSLSFCLQLNGIDMTFFDEKDNEVGVCVFPDGSIINDWTLFRGFEHARDASLEKFVRSYRAP